MNHRLHLLLGLCLLPLSFGLHAFELSSAEADRVGRLLWQNECGGTIEGLTSWNKGETFASLGIGHFIWYPPGQDGPFEESFPKLLAFVAQSGAKIPQWVLDTPDCPWMTREAFEADRHSEKMTSLRIFLKDTVGLQARFAAQRLKNALPLMLASLPDNERASVEKQFNRVAAHPHGAYVLVDYVNFKGEGVKPSERYQGKGWGLLQVLQNMKGTEPGPPALDEFSASAIHVLTQRVALSPPERGEKRWLPGWTNRCLTYRAP
ncbi:MAG: hypothetical protein SFU85_01445 [Candidatus Methylacidiphilales bacterium]|nr:hypothetical protein [Candidatus Methylacidiphilales bacterium]